MTAFENKLKNAGFRITEARKALYSVLKVAKVSLSAQELFDRLEVSNTSMKSDLASVYRNLTTFNELGLVHRLQDGRYSLCSHAGCTHDTHIHLVAMCTECGKTYEARDQTKDLDKKVKQLFSEISEIQQFSSLTLNGRCSKCLQ